ncbi:preprotein translocase subunit SecE [Candidatus Annandia adelgestsuga]|uniref:preprotein translocase subunit SecE n=1 Tax=Candidatus Annandia adelgestsuga TaxID=1302411 RepID=UPI0013002DAD|nr:preprotein translocase subunit SecE [Candidatus Annandia adelgestsuga]
MFVINNFFYTMIYLYQYIIVNIILIINFLYLLFKINNKKILNCIKYSINEINNIKWLNCKEILILSIYIILIVLLISFIIFVIDYIIIYFISFLIKIKY